MYSICYRESTECIVLAIRGPQKVFAIGGHRMYSICYKGATESICYRESTECVVLAIGSPQNV